MRDMCQRPIQVALHKVAECVHFSKDVMRMCVRCYQAYPAGLWQAVAPISRWRTRTVIGGIEAMPRSRWATRKSW
jgi:hypothetical protein